MTPDTEGLGRKPFQEQTQRDGGPSAHPAAQRAESPPAPQGHPASSARADSAADTVTDLVSALLLLLALRLWWTVDELGAQRIEVLVSTALLAAVLAVPHLARAVGLPSSRSPVTTRRLRMVAATPFVLVVIWHLAVLSTHPNGFMGPGAAIGLAGAALAAAPRTREIGPPELDRWVRPAWTWATVGMSASGVLLVVVGLARLLVEQGLGLYEVLSVLLVGCGLLLLVSSGIGVVRRTAAHLVAAAVVGASTTAALAVLALTDLSEIGGVPLQWGNPWMGVLVVPAVGALCTTPAVRGGVARCAAERVWLTGVARVWLVEALLAGFLAANVALYISSEDDETALVLMAVLVSVVVAAVVGRVVALRGSAPRIGVVRSVALVALLFGVAGFVVLEAFDPPLYLYFYTVLVLLALPLAALLLLLVPASVRRAAKRREMPRVEASRSDAPDAWAQQPQPGRHGGASGAGAPQQPGVPWGAGPQPTPLAPGPRPPAADSAAVEAADPATSPARLAELCSMHPHVRPLVAVHPRAYRALLDWLAALHDPAVDDALRRRPARR